MRTNNGCGTFSLASWRLQSKRHQVTFYIVSLVKISETTIASTTIAQTDGHWQAFSGLEIVKNYLENIDAENCQIIIIDIIGEKLKKHPLLCDLL